MPITVVEKFGSPQFQSRYNSVSAAFEYSGGTREYVIEGTNDEGDAVDALNAAAPLTLEGMELKGTRVEPVCDNFWFGSAEYGIVDLSGGGAPGEDRYTFNIAGEPQKKLVSISTIAKYPALTAPDFKNSINVQPDKTVEGVDIILPRMSFGIAKTHTDAEMDAAYFATLNSLVGKTNNGAFEGYAAGEVLFLGVQGQRAATNNWQVEYQFAVSPNETGLAFGTITGVDKKGWEYAWIIFETVIDEAVTPHFTVRRPKYVYVEKVYEAGNFGNLKI